MLMVMVIPPLLPLDGDGDGDGGRQALGGYVTRDVCLLVHRA